MFNIGIVGINGKMGKAIYKYAIENKIDVLFGVDVNFDTDYDCKTYTDFNLIKERPNCIIDFSSPKVLEKELKFASIYSIPVLIGTTGLNDSDYTLIKKYSTLIPILQSNNYSKGIIAIKNNLNDISKKLKNYDVRIIETHHKYKKDCPSGTAITLKNEIENKTVETLSIRAGNEIGTHEIVFYGKNEKISVIHQAYNKEAFIDGAFYYAKKLTEKKQGFYTPENL